MVLYLLDVNKNGVVDIEDVAIVAKNLADYRNQGPDGFKIDTTTYTVEIMQVVMYC